METKSYSKSYGAIFPFTLTIVAGKDSVETMINDCFKDGCLNLAPLIGQPMGHESDAVVYNNPNDTEVYLVITRGITVDILLHECVHIISRLFDIIGSDINQDTEEFFAYLNQFIFNESYSIITTKLKQKIPFNKNKLESKEINAI